MRKTPSIALAAVATLTLAGGVAVAQAPAPSHTLEMGVSPSKAGTKKKPKTVKSLELNIVNDHTANTTASRIEIFMPKQIDFNTKGFKTCSVDRLTDPERGPETCPKGSKVGEGTAGAVVGPGQSPLNFTNDFYVASAKSLAIDLRQVGGDVRAVLTAKIGKSTGKFGSKLTIDIPGELQQPAPGVYAALTAIQTEIEGTTGKGRKKHGILESEGCSRGEYAFRSRLTYAPNPNPPSAPNSVANDDVNCKK